MTANSSKYHRPSRRKTRRLRWLAGSLVVLGFLALALMGAGFLLLPRGGGILPGVSVADTALGGMTREQAVEAISKALAGQGDQSITLVAGPERQQTTLWDIGIRPDLGATVAGALRIGRDGSILFRIMQAIIARRSGMQVAPAYTVLQGYTRQTLTNFARQINRDPVDAAAHWDDTAQQVVLSPGHAGGKLNFNAAKKLITTDLIGKLGAGPAPDELQLPYQEKPARVTEDQLAQIDALLSSFTTSYTSSTSNRADNVATAAEAIDGTVVLPGEVFSYNKTVGPRTEDNGFKTAPEIVKGQLKPGIGGGVCQVSTTVYNAVLLANLQIVQRSHHSLPVHYVPPGRDATVSYPALDFKFRNNTNTPIVIETHTGGRKLTVRILGKGPAPQVSIERGDITSSPPSTVTRKDPGLPKGARVVDKGKNGLSVTVTRVVGEGDSAVREELSKDHYLGEPTVVRIGTGNAVNSATTTSLFGAGKTPKPRDR